MRDLRPDELNQISGAGYQHNTDKKLTDKKHTDNKHTDNKRTDNKKY